MSEPTPEALDFRWIAENTYDWESWITLDGRPAWASPAVERITGHSAADRLARPDHPLPLIAHRHRPEARETLRQGLAGWCGNDLPLRRANAQHPAGATIAREAYPAYFGALDTGRAIDAHRAPRTAELVADYLIPQSIGAMLDSPIVRSGNAAGALRHEHNRRLVVRAQ